MKTTYQFFFKLYLYLQVKTNVSINHIEIKLTYFQHKINFLFDFNTDNLFVVMKQLIFSLPVLLI